MAVPWKGLILGVVVTGASPGRGGTVSKLNMRQLGPRGGAAEPGVGNGRDRSSVPACEILRGSCRFSGPADSRRTAEVARLRRRAGAMAARRATATADRCRNIVASGN